MDDHKVCDKTGKIIISKADLDRVVEEAIDRVRSYHCKHCNGYHITSMRKNRKYKRR